MILNSITEKSEIRMKQQTFSETEYGNGKRMTKREVLLEIMDEIIPDWNCQEKLSMKTHKEA